MKASKAEAPPALSIVYRPLRDLVPYAQNARRHSASQVGKIKASLLEFGWANPMLVADNQMIAGHARLQSALALLDEGKPVPFCADPATGPTIDLSHLTARQRRAYVLADNRLAEEANWDLDLLRGEIEGLALDGNYDLSLAGFDPHELKTILGGWSADFTRQEKVDPVMDPLLGLIRLRYLRRDHDAIWKALRTAIEPFEGASAEQI